jgi:hypothetical protein
MKTHFIYHNLAAEQANFLIHLPSNANFAPKKVILSEQIKINAKFAQKISFVLAIVIRLS